MKYKFSEIVDISKLQKLMEGFYSTTNILSAVLDTDANISDMLQYCCQAKCNNIC